MKRGAFIYNEYCCYNASNMHCIGSFVRLRERTCRGTRRTIITFKYEKLLLLLLALKCEWIECVSE